MSNPFEGINQRLDNIEGLLLDFFDRNTKPKPLAYSKQDFAKAINKSTSFVDAERRAGRLEWSRNGGTVSIPASELSKYIIVENQAA